MCRFMQFHWNTRLAGLGYRNSFNGFAFDISGMFVGVFSKALLALFPSKVVQF